MDCVDGMAASQTIEKKVEEPVACLKMKLKMVIDYSNRRYVQW